jgi:hypothetical protein
MAAGGTPGNVLLGAGRLYVAPLGTAEPTSCSAALPSAWIAVGYTDDGTTVDIDLTSEAIEVAEELDPIRFSNTKRTTKLSFASAESTKKRLALALGGGAGFTDDAATFEFPDPSAIVGVMFVWDSDEVPSATNRRWLFRQCTPSGTVSRSAKKAPAKSLIPMAFDCAKPGASTAPVKTFPNASGQV